MMQKMILVYISNSMGHLLRQDFTRMVDHRLCK